MFGIPVYLDLSLIVLLFMFALNGGIQSGLVCAALLLASITAHELGHALTARAFGYQTRDITLSLLGGCASLIALPRKASQEFLTALAGPAVSVAICVLAIFGLTSGQCKSGDSMNVQIWFSFFAAMSRCLPARRRPIISLMRFSTSR